MGGGWSKPRPGPFTPGKENGTYFVGGWVGPRALAENFGPSCKAYGRYMATFTKLPQTDRFQIKPFI